MRIELTVVHHERAHDVAIEAPLDADIGAIRAAVGSRCPADRSKPLWFLGAALRDGATWSQVGLRTGSTVNTTSDVGRARSTAALSLSVVAGPFAGRTIPLSRGRLTIGRGLECDVVFDDPDTSRTHAAIIVDGTSATVRDLGSTNGTTLDGDPVGESPVVIAIGSWLRIGENTLSITGPEGPPAITAATEGAVRVIRPPRRTPPLTAGAIEVPTTAPHSRPRPVQWLAALLPAAAGGALVWITGSVQFLLFALLSPAMVLGGALGDRLHWRRSRRRMAAKAARQSAQTDQMINSALRAEIEIRRRRTPDPSMVARIVSIPTDRLWERGRGDEDLLVVRLGTGQLPSATMIERDGRCEPAGKLADVPICVALREGPLGLAGPARSVDSCARWIVGQLAALHSPADVNLALLLGASAERRWRWARWLPHLSRQVMTAAERADLVDELAARLGRPAGGRSSTWTGRWTVLVMDRAADLDDVAGLSALLRAGPAIGVTALVLADDSSALPSACVSVATVSGESGTRFALRRHGIATERGILADQVNAQWADSVSRSLAPLVDPGPDDTGMLPATCTLSDIHGAVDANSLAARWANSAGVARATIGLGSDGPIKLDLTTDGPHALIAGTTGSGKSELLQALVAGLALDQSPAELNFLLIDYKGGAAFADCARLPHTAGLVTDLDSYLTGRALRSLRSELRRRESLLNTVGATDLCSYRRGSPPTPIPRLVIVVDEFAALAEELPDFVHGLVAVAQRGRSLGVHLVLATQRPGSAVSPEIKANTALRIALRVTDSAESSDVIDAPDAATLPRAAPGRAYLRTGSTLRSVQGAWPGAQTSRTTDAIRVELLDNWRRPVGRAETAHEQTDLSRLVDVVVATASRDRVRAASAPWTTPLTEHLDRCALPDPPRSTSVVFGLVDLPDEQRQEPATLDLVGAESLLMIGAPRSGRTTALRTIAIGAAQQLPPGQLDIYSVDPAGALASTVSMLPHNATTLDGQDVDLTIRLFTLLEQHCIERARAEPDPVADDVTHKLLLVDGLDTLTDSLSDSDSARLAEQLTRLLRVAPAGGLSVLASGDRSLLSPRVAGAFARKVVLRLSDVSDYAAFGISPRDVPAPMPPGRAIRIEDCAALQIATTAPTQPGKSEPTTASRVAAIRRQWVGTTPNPSAIRLRRLPPSVQFDALTTDRAKQDPSDGSSCRLLLGVAGDTATPLLIDLVRHPGHMIVAGPPRSGRSTVLRLLYRQARAAGMATIVAGGPRSPLTVEARSDSTAIVLGPDDDIGDVPSLDRQPTLLLVDDSELWTDSALGEVLSGWLRRCEPELSAVVAGRSDDLVTTYRGIAAQARRSQRGILLRPGPIDGELLGVRLPRRPSTGPPGRGVMIGDPSWDTRFRTGEPVPIQIASIDEHTSAAGGGR